VLVPLYSRRSEDLACRRRLMSRPAVNLERKAPGRREVRDVRAELLASKRPCSAPRSFLSNTPTMTVVGRFPIHAWHQIVAWPVSRLTSGRPVTASWLPPVAKVSCAEVARLGRPPREAVIY